MLARSFSVVHYSLNHKSIIMKKYIISGICFLLFMSLQLPLLAQENLKVNETEIKSWVSQNWLWIAGALVVLIIIIAASGSRRSKRKTTTIVKDDYGNVKSVSSTEIIE